MESITWLGHWWLLSIISGILLAWGMLKKYSLAKKAGGLGLVTLLISEIVVGILKVLIGRPRPQILESGVSHVGPSMEEGYDSFPSGHSVSAFTMAVVLSFVFPRWRLWWYMTAVLVAFSRVYMDIHFVSDVLAGGIVGVLVAKGLFSVCPRILRM